MEGTMYDRGVAGVPDIYTIEQTVCIPVIDEAEDPETYAIDLPDHILTAYRRQIHRGQLHVLIMGASIEGDTVRTTSTTTFSVVNDYGGGRDAVPPIRQLQDQPISDKYTHAFGQKRYALVRISTHDSSPTFSLEQMVRRFTDPREGMEAQYRDCSHSQLSFHLAGAYDIKLPGSISAFNENARALREGAVERLVADYNIATFPDDVADYVLYCIPPGTGFMGRECSHRTLSLAIQR